MIKNHPFQNGNKRIAVTTLLTFLALNDRWISVSNKKLYTFAKNVAQSNAQEKDLAVREIEEFINTHGTSI